MPVLFTCPTTNRQVPTRVHMDAKAFAWRGKRRCEFNVPTAESSTRFPCAMLSSNPPCETHSIGRCSTGSLLLCRPD